MENHVAQLLDQPETEVARILNMPNRIIEAFNLGLLHDKWISRTIDQEWRNAFDIGRSFRKFT